MPDLLTHTLVITPFKKLLRKNFTLVLMGMVLPDIVSRIPGIILPNRSFISWMQAALHSPIALLLACLFFSFFFSQKIRKKAFLALSAGTFIHLFMDLFQKTFIVGYFWFFPFSFKSFWVPVFWPNDSIYFVPFLVILNLMCYKITNLIL